MSLEELREVLRLLKQNQYGPMQSARILVENAVIRLERAQVAERRA